MDEPITALDRYASAINGGPGWQTALGAAGMADADTRNRLGFTLARIKFGTPSAADRFGAETMLYHQLRQAERSKRIRMGNDNGMQVVKRVMRWWLNDTCDHCDGRRFQLIPGTPHLSERACPQCHGTGMAHFPDTEPARFVRDLVEQSVFRAAAGMRSHLREGA